MTSFGSGAVELIPKAVFSGILLLLGFYQMGNNYIREIRCPISQLIFYLI
jgi:MFS superfamily sulfate permease-like transporter